MFGVMDIDNDGTITEEEFMIYCRDRGLFQDEVSKVKRRRIWRHDKKAVRE